MALPDGRPPADKRKFVSQAVEDLLVDYGKKMKDQDLKTIFNNCLPNTLDTTVEYFGDYKGLPASFIITG